MIALEGDTLVTRVFISVTDDPHGWAYRFTPYANNPSSSHFWVVMDMKRNVVRLRMKDRGFEYGDADSYIELNGVISQWWD